MLLIKNFYIMEDFMITYFKMKRQEWKVKAILYGMLVRIMRDITHEQPIKEQEAEHKVN